MTVRKEYTDILSTNPRYAISPQDLDISRTCEQLLIHESSFNELKGYVGKRKIEDKAINFFPTYNTFKKYKFSSLPYIILLEKKKSYTIYLYTV